jgi:hypothetical protein
MSHGHQHQHTENHEDTAHHAHTHGHDHGHGHSHGHEEPAAETDEAHGGKSSERYELGELFRGEAPENQHFLMVLSVVILVVLLALALAYPLIVK